MWAGYLADRRQTPSLCLLHALPVPCFASRFGFASDDCSSRLDTCSYLLLHTELYVMISAPKHCCIEDGLANGLDYLVEIIELHMYS